MRRGVDRDNFFVDHVRYGKDNRAVAVIEGPGVVIYEKKKKKKKKEKKKGGTCGNVQVRQEAHTMRDIWSPRAAVVTLQ